MVLALSGLTAPSSGATTEFRLVELRKTWTEARSYCREAFTDLATVEHQSANDELLSAARRLGDHAWIGLYDNRAVGWTWALGEEDSTNQYSNWEAGQPDNKNYGQTCGAIKPSGLWIDRFCQVLRPAVCYDEKGPDDYIIVAAQQTWYEARAYCRSHFTDLASGTTRAETNRISSLLTAESWFGLHRKTWAYWSDRTPNSFTNWDQNQPRGRGSPVVACAALHTTTGMWWDVDCDVENYFICQKVYSRQQQTFKLRFKSRADMTDPALQQQLLQQLHHKLETSGLSDFKLRWTQTDGEAFHKEPKTKKQKDVISSKEALVRHSYSNVEFPKLNLTQ
ncbi:Macrophage mannose receptor 1 [Liparis tanakae]|uniref:Macrophage mannose receptor 1 n=1 Tax=Liparis tanakae TaxID=230148 RepID=A0A4Z2EVU4_9TELE|nr:Macrophage mannose receptor 1 [Liparis tanakae]